MDKRKTKKKKIKKTVKDAIDARGTNGGGRRGVCVATEEKKMERRRTEPTNLIKYSKI